jgi:hypothetical protein
VTRLAVDDRARAFKALSPGMLPPLGIIFGLLVGFTAAQVWSDFEKAKVAVATEASALRSVVLLSQMFPNEQGARLRVLIGEHVDIAVNQEWPEMAGQRASLTAIPVKLVEALNTTLSLTPADDGQKLAQQEIMRSIETALDARRQRIIISQSTVGPIKWAGLLLQALCTLIAISLVHSDNRATYSAGAVRHRRRGVGLAHRMLQSALHRRRFRSPRIVAANPHRPKRRRPYRAQSMMPAECHEASLSLASALAAPSLGMVRGSYPSADHAPNFSNSRFI